MNEYKERWNDFEWYEKILVTPGILLFGSICILVSPVILFMSMVILTIEFFGGDDYLD
jgi:hypothetical protein